MNNTFDEIFSTELCLVLLNLSIVFDKFTIQIVTRIEARFIARVVIDYY